MGPICKVRGTSSFELAQRLAQLGAASTARSEACRPPASPTTGMQSPGGNKLTQSPCSCTSPCRLLHLPLERRPASVETDKVVAGPGLGSPCTRVHVCVLRGVCLQLP